MNAFVAKELRLLLPAYVMALLLAVVPVWTLPGSDQNAATLALYPFWLGVSFLGLSCFGREFTLRTFPLLLVQPRERATIWRTKVSVLAAATGSVFLAWFLSCAAFGGAGDPWREALGIGAAAAVVTFAGGLWSTLLLRQITAAFWFTLLIPGAILMFTRDAPKAVIFAALGAYAVAGFWWARRQFLHAQDVAWTGGIISFPAWRGASDSAGSALRRYRPLAALFWKELQLHQVGLLGMAWLFLVHLGVIWLRKAGADHLSPTLEVALQVFGGLWLVVPLLAGSPAVAEERKLGTLEGHLCLPVSSRIQLALKLAVALLVGGLLSPVLLWTAEGIASTVGAGSDVNDFKTPFSGSTLAGMGLIFTALSLVSFYASTLSRNIIQGLATAVVTTLVFWALAVLSIQEHEVNWLWHGALIHYLAWPTLLVLLLWLAHQNFRFAAGEWALWRRNLLFLGGWLGLTVATTSLAYHRVWELVLPLEPAHGSARLPLTSPPKVSTLGGAALAIRLPDGRLWTDRIGYDKGSLQLAVNGRGGVRIGAKWTGTSTRGLVAGSNWVEAVALSRGETVAIRTDGTLWVSEKPAPKWNRDEGAPPATEPAPLVRYGDETNWQSVVPGFYRSVFLLKRDGTLWGWGTNSLSDRYEWPGMRGFVPFQVGSDSNWGRLASSAHQFYAWKRDGVAWLLRPQQSEREQPGGVALEPGMVMTRVPAQDGIVWRNFARVWPFQAGVREDGTLWVWQQKNNSFTPTDPVQLGQATDWAAVAGDSLRLVALKKDGSLWKWEVTASWHDLFESELKSFSEVSKGPVQLSAHRDWVAVSSQWEGVLSLSADGSLWYWWNRAIPPGASDTGQPLLAHSRRPQKILEIFAQP